MLAMRAARWLGTASHLMIRVAEFRCRAPGEQERKAKELRWRDWLHADVPLAICATSRASRAFHTGLIAERVRSARSVRTRPRDCEFSPSEVLGRETRRLRDAREHSRPNLVAFMKRPDVIRPSHSLHYEWEPRCRFSVHPILRSAARTRGARTLRQRT